MAENTKIEWADHTFNPWVGCAKKSPACDNCYAEAWAKRAGRPELWSGTRTRTRPENWKKVLKWNKAAEATGQRARVFCASLADVFDDEVPPEWRADLWALIDATWHLDWLLLTKRPENIANMLPAMNSHAPLYRPWKQRWPWDQVSLGTTVENQAEADRRIPHLLDNPADRYFLSCEPLLGPVDLSRYLRPTVTADGFSTTETPGIGWVIAGGESGPGARPMHPHWARSLRDQCAAAGVSFFFKQWGEYEPVGHVDRGSATDPNEFAWKRIGKKAAGRLLDGREHNEVPG